MRLKFIVSYSRSSCLKLQYFAIFSIFKYICNSCQCAMVCKSSHFWCTSLEDRSACLLETLWETSGRLRTWRKHTTASSHSRCLNFLPTQIKHHMWKLAVILNLKHFSCSPHQWVTSTPDWLTFAEVPYSSNTSSMTPVWYNPKEGSIPTIRIPLTSPWGTSITTVSSAQVQIDEFFTTLLPKKH